MSWRLALRLARREVVRRPGRALLVVLLVAVPVCGMTIAAVLFRTEQLTPAQAFRLDNYEADAALSAGAADDGRADGLPDPDRALPAGARTLDVRSAWVMLEGPVGTLRRVYATDGAVEGADLVGQFRLLEGRAPRQPGEVALSPRSARQVEAGIDDEVIISTYSHPSEFGPIGETPDPASPEADEPQPLTVVGVVEDSRDLSSTTGVVHPDQLLPQLQDETEMAGPAMQVTRLAYLPRDVPEAQLENLVRAGWEVAPDLLEAGSVTNQDTDADQQVRWAIVIGAVVLTAAGIVISAAFAVSARRQLTTLGQLSATGASPRLLRWALAFQGTVSGVLGLLVGWGLAALILAVGRGRFEEMLGQRLPAWDLQPSNLAAIAVLAVAAATAAAFIPARTAARIPTLSALAGRRPVAPVPHVLTVAGLAAMTIGLGFTALAILGAKGGRETEVWAFVATMGGVLELLGACAVTPALASRLEPLASRLRGSWRLGARSLARNRTRTGAVAAAVAVAGAIAVFAGGLVRTFEARSDAQDWYELPDTLAVASVYRTEPASSPEDGAVDEATIARIEAALPEAEHFPIQRGVQEPGTDEMWKVDAPEPPSERGGEWAAPAVVADEKLLDAFKITELREALDADGLVWLTTWAEPSEDFLSGAVTVTLPDGTELPATRVSGRKFQTGLGELVMSPDLARSLSLASENVAVALETPEPLTEDQHEALASRWSYSGESGGLDIRFAASSNELADYPIEALLSGAALVVALLVTGTSLALTAAESRDEREVLTIVGTRPRDLARSAGAKAGLLAFLGAAVAVPLGMAQITVVSWTAGDDFPIRPPWMVLALTLVAVPVIVALTARTSSSIAQRVRPIHISTATFE